jgi:hypothetical protein
MAWRRFEKVPAGKTKEGHLKYVFRLEFKLSNPSAFLAYAKPRIAEFVLHHHVAKWQDTAYKASIAKLKAGEVMSLIDFTKNYSFKGQNEVQSQHWYNFQLTILVHIMYTVNPFYDALDKDSKRLCTTYYHWHDLVLAGNIPSRHIVWSDGCAAQFKGAKAWFYIAK